MHGGVVAQLVSATVHWATQSSPGFVSRLEPPTVGILRGGRWFHCVRQKTSKKIYLKKFNAHSYPPVLSALFSLFVPFVLSALSVFSSFLCPLCSHCSLCSLWSHCSFCSLEFIFFVLISIVLISLISISMELILLVHTHWYKYD